MKIALATFDYVILGAYFLTLIGVGVYFARRQKGGRDYFTGGRRIPWWAAGVCLYMANFSAFMYAGNAAFTFEAGLFSVFYWSLYPFCYFLGALLTATQWRRSRSVSPVEFTQARFNVLTQQLIALVLVIVFLNTAAVQLVAIGKIVGPSLPFTIPQTMAAISFVALIFTIFGGLSAVAFSDVIQFVILFLVTVAIVVLSIGEVGGVFAFGRNLPPLQTSLDFKGVHYDGWYVLGYLTVFTLGTAQGGGTWFYSVRDERAAHKVGLAATALFFTSPILFCVPVLAARMIWPELPSEQREQVFVLLCQRLLPVGTMGFFLAAALSATLDNLSSVSTMISSLVTRDIVPLLLRRKLSDRHELHVGRLASLLVGGAIFFLAWRTYSDQSALFNEMVKYIGLLGPVISIPIVLGLRMRSFPRWGGLASLSWGLILGVACQFFLEWQRGPQFCLVIGVTLTLSILLPRLATWWKEEKRRRVLILAGIAFLFVGVALCKADIPQKISPEALESFTPDWASIAYAWGAALLVAGGVIGFAALTARETNADREPVNEFFKLLDTPVNVDREVIRDAAVAEERR